ncbi:VOC family protein [Sphingomonas profundi]|uniref:VOC family protein n=1 Tax=Alterirhizorhabdus profundi TaxID=2681549 RepID=UPI0012E7A69F|nr:VOC family protein [Sphingomonas profundi]
MSDRIGGLHHITLCTGSAQGDIDLFYKTLGMSLVKRTLLYDGGAPIYHLYFGNETGDPGTLTTVFPFRRDGRKAKRGAGQIELCSYSVPKGAVPYWKERLTERGVPIVKVYERFGQQIIQFEHPDCGLNFELVEETADDRKPFVGGDVPPEHAIRGFHNWTVLTRDNEDMDIFMKDAWNYRELGADGAFTRYAVEGGKAAHIIDVHLQPDARPGSWFYGEGMIHHGAFAVPNLDVQHQVKLEVEGMGLTDFSDRKHRGYFESIYVRTPGGALFEATHSLGFDVDEAADRLGQEVIVSPQFRDRRDQIVTELNDPFELN